MSNTPAAAQAAQHNQQFWQGIAKLPEEAQKSFWEAGAALSKYIGESPTPRALKFDTTSPPADWPLWKKLLFYVGQGQYNQSVGYAQMGQSTAESAKWLWGALQGDFNRSPTTGQVITGGVISLIPVVDQVCDVRDIIANCMNLSDAKARDEPENWIALGLTCIGFVPLFGSAVKTVGKVALKNADRLIDLLKQMEWLEKHRGSLKIAIPWGRAPIEWLKKYDWQGAMKQGAAKAKTAFLNAKQKALDAASFAFGVVQAKLKQLAELFNIIANKIGDVMADLGKRIKQKIDQLLSKAKKEAGNYDATPGAPNKHGQGDKEPPRRGGTTPPHKVERTLTADEANAPHVKAGRNPPYADGKAVQDIRLKDDATFARVHGPDNKARSWMMRKEDIEGLTPVQIKDKFALPDTPTLVSDVNVPAGTLIRTGEVAPQVGWGSGGATQFELLNRLPENLFTNTRPFGGGL